MSFTYCCLVTQLCLTLLETPWTVAHQVPLSMGFSRQEYWNGLPSPTPGDFPNPRIQLPSPILAGRFFTILTPVAVQSFSLVWLWDPMDCRRPCPSLSPRAYSNMCPFESVMPSNHCVPRHPLLLLPSIFPRIRNFSNKLAPLIMWSKY